jgi:hypothetical protein
VPPPGVLRLKAPLARFFFLVRVFAVDEDDDIGVVFECCRSGLASEPGAS